MTRAERRQHKQELEHWEELAREAHMAMVARADRSIKAQVARELAEEELAGEELAEEELASDQARREELAREMSREMVYLEALANEELDEALALLGLL